MTLLHGYFHTRNLRGFQRLLSSDGTGSAGLGGGGGWTDNERTQGAAAALGTNTPSSSYPGGEGRSWSRSIGLSGSGHRTHSQQQLHLSISDPNARDSLGRTVLHLACASIDSIEYTRALLKHPVIDVNATDGESRWTPLHRALYHANLPAALLLLQRTDTNTSLKDWEGYTAFDLYNSTLNHTKPDKLDIGAELYTWGANRNAALGLGDSDDRSYPEHVSIKHKEDTKELEKKCLSARFGPIHVRQVQMSKLHTAVVTVEAEGNFRICGFGSGGRLGPSLNPHQQYDLKPLPGFNQSIVSVALGQDHTLALTESGEVFSWGLNRFSQLGYVVELAGTSASRHEEPIQAVPKKIAGMLRREVVIGVAASKNASVCWTEDTVFTWGTNTGHLGYDSTAQLVQILPRPVTKFTNKVVDIAMSETVLCGLLVTKNVECIWNDRHYRIIFPTHAFPTGIQPYRPPQAVKDSLISKVTCCDETFAALSQNGEVFTFMPPSASTNAFDGTGSDKYAAFKPQRVWALRKKFSSVKDVALGSDGSIIICTESGHVFVRTRNVAVSSTTVISGSGGNKPFKFERISFLQRVAKVCANSTGAFAALRVGYVPPIIEVTGNTLPQDLRCVQPWVIFYNDKRGPNEGWDGCVGQNGMTRGKQRDREAFAQDSAHQSSIRNADLVDDDVEDNAAIQNDIKDLLQLCSVLQNERRLRQAGGGIVGWKGLRLPFDGDSVVHILPMGVAIPVHRIVLAARSTKLRQLLDGSLDEVKDDKVPSDLAISSLPAEPGPGLGVSTIYQLATRGFHPLTILIFFRYLYSDDLLSIWDPRIRMDPSVEQELAKLGLDITDHAVKVKGQLQALGRMFELQMMIAVLEAPVKRILSPTLTNDMAKLFDHTQKVYTGTSGVAFGHRDSLRPDVVLQLAEGKDIFTHSVLLRARSPFFAGLFGLDDWTLNRWTKDGLIKVNLTHLHWDVIKFVIGFMCCGWDEEMFSHLDTIYSIEDLLGFIFAVLGGANELLLDRLVLLSSSVILKHVSISNACYVLSEATHYHASQLIERLQGFISVNLDTFLESRLLDDIPYALVKQLSFYIKRQQTDKSPFSRSDTHLQQLTIEHAKWLEEEDFPEHILTRTYGAFKKDSSAPAGQASGSYKVSRGLHSPARFESTEYGSLGRKGGRIASGEAEYSGTDSRPFSTLQKSLKKIPSGDEIFIMDGLDVGDVDDAPQSQVAPLPRATASPSAWKSIGPQKVDMKTVMVEAAAAQAKQSRPSFLPTQRSTTSSIIPSSKQSRLPDPRHSEATSTAKLMTTVPSTGSLGASSIPLGWGRPSNHSAVAPGTLPPAQAGSSQSIDQSSVFRPAKDTPLSETRLTQLRSTPSTPTKVPTTTLGPGLSPIITPTRAPSLAKGASGARVAGQAWAHPPVQPNPSSISTTHSPSMFAPSTSKTKSPSFLSIQQSQQSDQFVKEPKRSLREIQEEEASLQAEADFLKWWTAEEERVKEEERKALVEAEEQSRTYRRKERGEGRGKKRDHNGDKPRRIHKQKMGDQVTGDRETTVSLDPTPSRGEGPPRQHKKPRKPSGTKAANPLPADATA